MSVANPGVSLMWLLDGLAAVPPTPAHIVDLTLDSREVRAGSLFFALRGARSHGLDFCREAAARGARVVLWDPAEAAGHAAPPGVEAGVEAGGRHSNGCQALPVAGLRHLLGRIADRFFGGPSAQLCVTGITGTNGKTTTAYLLAQALERQGHPAGYVGTIGWGRLDALQVPKHTTADVITVHRQLAALKAAGARHVAMEVSSHALDQGRVDGVRFHTAAFTNLTRDHLDYHGSMQAYGAAKARLFVSEGLRHSVINIGDAFGRELARGHRGPTPLTVVWAGESDSDWLADRSLHAREVKLDLDGLSMQIGGSFGAASMRTRLVGRFNAENALTVLGCLLALDIPLDAAASAVSGCTAPPGRMELIAAPRHGKPVAVVDYAHTPDALAKALSALREHCDGALWCVFGCGGDRDMGKRPIMGAIADTLADEIIVTDDNPRSEDPGAITAAIAAGISRHAVRVIHDRGEAIATALGAAAANDLVLIAGKGHEDYQIYGDTRRDFSDRAHAQRCLGVAA
jgi:UDP-N-acetylmuramoyl-L-alanyl-D-glutamate--2,6-diaminopimelate ligase